MLLGPVLLGILLAVASLQEIGHHWRPQMVEGYQGDVYAINAVWGSWPLDNAACGRIHGHVRHCPGGQYGLGGYRCGTASSGNSSHTAPVMETGPDHWLRSRWCDGPERIDFVWHLKKISLLAIAGYLAGGVFG